MQRFLALLILVAALSFFARRILASFKANNTKDQTKPGCSGGGCGCGR